MIGAFVMFCMWTMACGLAPNWAAFLVFRLFVGIFASGPLAIVTGILADIYNSHRARGRAMAAFMAVRRPFYALHDGDITHRIGTLCQLTRL